MMLQYTLPSHQNNPFYSKHYGFCGAADKIMHTGFQANKHLLGDLHIKPKCNQRLQGSKRGTFKKE